MHKRRVQKEKMVLKANTDFTYEDMFVKIIPKLTSRQVQWRDLPLQHDLIGRGVRPDIPEPDALINVTGYDGGTGTVGCHQVIATGSGELCFYACGWGIRQLSDFKCAARKQIRLD